MQEPPEALITLEVAVEADLAEALEARFCEDLQEHFFLTQDWRSGQHSLQGVFATPETAALAWQQLREGFPQLPEQVTHGSLLNRDWQEAYKAHFRPWSDRGVHFVPVWERDRYALPEGDVAVYLDPGMAFGTGNHETTRLCLRRLIDRHASCAPGRAAQLKVIDAGCGSGILAITAALLGFREVDGFDNDPDAVRISGENAALCGVAGRIRWSWHGLDEGLRTTGQGELVLANILAPVLLAHRDALVGAVRPGGQLVLSGILAHEGAALAEAFFASAQAAWACPALASPDLRQEGDWVDVLLARPASEV